MNLSDAPAAGGQTSSLHESWRAASLAAGWLHPGDWDSPAAEVMAHAVASGEGAEAAAAILGSDRSARGVGLAEALADLDSLYWAASSTEPPFGVVRELALGWAEATTEAFVGRGAIDAATGLATADYLETRLREIYAEQGATGRPACDTWCLICVIPKSGSRRSAVLDRAERARIIEGVLAQGESNAVLDSGAMVSLARTASALEHVLRLRHRFRALGTEPEVRIESLPAARDDALAVLRAL